MPVLKHARKKLRQDKKRTKANQALKDRYRKFLKDATKSSTPEKIRLAVQAIDKATKNGILHQNKAARMKSTLAKLSVKKKTTTQKAPVSPVKKTKSAAKKSSVKTAKK